MRRPTAIQLDQVRKGVIRHAHSGNIQRTEVRDHGFYLEGSVPTPLGIVYVYSETSRVANGRPFEYSFYKFVAGGYEFNYSEKFGRTKRGLTLMAHRFAQHVMQEVEA